MFCGLFLATPGLICYHSNFVGSEVTDWANIGMAEGAYRTQVGDLRGGAILQGSTCVSNTWTSIPSSILNALSPLLADVPQVVSGVSSVAAFLQEHIIESFPMITWFLFLKRSSE